MTKIEPKNSGLEGSKLVGRLLYDLRKQRGMTGSALGRKASLSQSKISKLETGYYARLLVQDVDRLLNILEAPNDIRQTIYREIEREQPQALTYKPYPFNGNGPNYYELDKQAELIRQFTMIVPALLQTPAYRIAALRRWGVLEADLGLYLKDMSRRQDLIWESGRSFHFIMLQASLYVVPNGDLTVMAPQFDRIERLMDLPNVRVGIIPMEAGLPMSDFGVFALHDRRLLFLAQADGEIQADDEAKISLYSRVFTEMSELAVYGDQAKALMRRAVASFEGRPKTRGR